MTDTALPQDDSRARRNVAVLVGAQAVLGAQMPMIFVVGGLAGQSLASNPCFATLPISLIVLGSMLSFFAASFIIMTGLTVDVAERQRDLAVLRCVGGARWQLASSQLSVGVLIGGIGALIGVPLGLVGCAGLFWLFDKGGRANA